MVEHNGRHFELVQMLAQCKQWVIGNLYHFSDSNDRFQAFSLKDIQYKSEQ